MPYKKKTKDVIPVEEKDKQEAEKKKEVKKENKKSDTAIGY